MSNQLWFRSIPTSEQYSISDQYRSPTPDKHIITSPLSAMPMPDASIHPTATGKAKQTVDEHQAPQDLIFYSGETLVTGTMRLRLSCMQQVQTG